MNNLEDNIVSCYVYISNNRSIFATPLYSGEG